MDHEQDVQLIEEAARRLPTIAEQGRTRVAEFRKFAADLGAKTPAAAEDLASRLGIPGETRIEEQNRQELARVSNDVAEREARVDRFVKSRVAADRGVDDTERSYAFSAKVKPLLDAGRGAGEILDVVRNDRAAIAALRDAAEPAMIASGAEPGSISLDELHRDLDDAEIELLEPSIREARLADRAREGAVRAFEASARFVLEGRDRPVDLIKLGYDHGSALGVRADLPGRREWRQMVDEIDPHGVAERERGALDPATRATMEENAREIGFRRTTGPEMSGPEAVGRMRR